MIPSQTLLALVWSLVLVATPTLMGQDQEMTDDGRQVTLSQALPTGELATSQVLLQSFSPVNVVPGVPYVQTLRITNLTDCPLADLNLYQTLHPQLTLVRSLPKPARQEQSEIKWELGTLAAHGMTSVEVRVVPSAEGQYEQCLSLTWVPAACVGVNVIAPLLSLKQVMPRAVLGCEELAITAVVANPGSAALTNITVTTILPSGLLTSTGEQMHRFVVPALGPGQTAERTFAVSAVQTGTYHVRSTATSADGMSREVAGDIMVRQPYLELAVKSRDRQFTGRDVIYEITVANKGDATADGIVVRTRIPQNTAFVSVANGGRMSEDQQVSWEVPPLGAGESRTVSVTVRSMTSGRAELTAQATASCAAPAQAMGATQIFGIAAVLLEVVDTQDPIEVGGEGAYLIKVTNQGNKADTNLVVACQLEATQEFLSAEGPTRAQQSGKTIQFAALDTLAPGQEVVWRVKIRAAEAGDVRFRAQLTSDQLQRPVHETESTSQY